MGLIESADGFAYRISTRTHLYSHCHFQPISLTIKVVDAVEFGKYFKFLLTVQEQSSTQTRRNAFTLLMEEAGKLVCPEKVDICENNKQRLYNKGSTTMS